MWSSETVMTLDHRTVSLSPAVANVFVSLAQILVSFALLT